MKPNFNSYRIYTHHICYSMLFWPANILKKELIEVNFLHPHIQQKNPAPSHSQKCDLSDLYLESDQNGEMPVATLSDMWLTIYSET